MGRSSPRRLSFRDFSSDHAWLFGNVNWNPHPLFRGDWMKLSRRRGVTSRATNAEFLNYREEGRSSHTGRTTKCAILIDCACHIPQALGLASWAFQPLEARAWIGTGDPGVSELS